MRGRPTNPLVTGTLRSANAAADDRAGRGVDIRPGELAEGEQSLRGGIPI
jgi:hypothetical protein